VLQAAIHPANQDERPQNSFWDGGHLIYAALSYNNVANWVFKPKDVKYK